MPLKLSNIDWVEDSICTSMEPDSFSPLWGLRELFHVGQYAKAENTLRKLNEMEVTEFRTYIRSGNWNTSEGREWYQWLIPELARNCSLLPCFIHTRPWVSAKKLSPAICDLRSYLKFTDQLISSFKNCFEWIEMRNPYFYDELESQNPDSKWLKFWTMLGGVTHHARQYGKKIVVGGLRLNELKAIRQINKGDFLQNLDAIGIDFNPGGQDALSDLLSEIGLLRKLIHRSSNCTEIWITETGPSIHKYDDFSQQQKLNTLITLPLERIYWSSLEDFQMRLLQGNSNEADFRFKDLVTQ